MTHLISVHTPSALRHDYVSESLNASVSSVISWTFVWPFFVFLRELPLFHYFGPSVGLMCWVLASVRSQRNSNFCRKTVSDFLSDVLTTPPWLQFRISNFIGVGYCFLNCPITLFLFLKELPHFIVSDFLMVRCVEYWWAKSVAQQDSNLRRKTASDFLSDALTTRPRLHDASFTLLCVGHCFLNCPDNRCWSLFLERSWQCVSVIVSWTVLLFFSQGVTSISVFQTVWWFDILSTGERKVSQSEIIELAQENPIWIIVRRLNHSAMTAWRKIYFPLCRSLLVELLWEFFLLKVSRKYLYLGTSDRIIK